MQINLWNLTLKNMNRITYKLNNDYFELILVIRFEILILMYYFFFKLYPNDKIINVYSVGKRHLPSFS